MATIANLGVSLTARIGNFEKGFKRAQRIAGRFSSDIVRHTKTIAAYGAATVGVAAYATGRLVKQQMAAIDSTSKLARTFGLATEELVGYQHAATLAGVDSNKLSQAILKVNKSTDASLAGLTTDERLLAIAEQYRGITDAAQRATFLVKMFGEEGYKIGTLFENGAAGILQARKEAVALGIAFEDIDGRQVEAANDAITRMQEAITGAANRIAIQLAPFIQVAADRLREFAMGWNVTGEASTNAFNAIANGMGMILNVIDGLRVAWNSFMAGVLSGAAAMANLNPITGPRRLVQKVLEKISGKEAQGNAFDAVIDGFEKAAVEAAERSNEAFGRIFTGENTTKAQQFFKGVQIDAAKAAAAIEAGMVPAVESAGASASSKTAEFRQVDLSRIAIGGPGGRGSAQKVEDPQLKTTNAILTRIESSLNSPLVTA